MMRSPSRVATQANELFATPTCGPVAPPASEAKPKVYTVLACSLCRQKVETSRTEYLAKHRDADPAAVTSSATGAKNAKKAGIAVERVEPDADIHTLSGLLHANARIRSPYGVTAWVGAGLKWDGVCTKQDICVQLAATGQPGCICHITERVDKRMVACLEWVNCGKCDPSKHEQTKCPYAHPDLTHVHPDICCNFYTTGFCRFSKSVEEVAVAPTENGQVKKRSNRGGRGGTTNCKGCHCVVPEGGFPLLPGLTKKILRNLRVEGKGADRKVLEYDCTDLNNALALYVAYLDQ
jgi:hypothetical protein